VTTTSKYQVRTTSTNGLPHIIPATAKTCDRIAVEQSRLSDIIEADVLYDGEFLTAYVNGAKVFQ
jgi:hypothetical protein